MLPIQPSGATPNYAFTKYDDVIIDGVVYELIDRTEDGYIFIRQDRQGVPETFTKSDMARRVDLGQVEHRRGARLPESAKARVTPPTEELWTRTVDEHRRARMKEGAVLAFLDLEREGKVKRTAASIKENLSLIKGKAAEFLAVPSSSDTSLVPSDTIPIPKKMSPRSIRRWVENYEALRLAGLYDKSSQRGNRSRRLSLEELALMSSVVRTFASEQKPTKEQIFWDVRRAFMAENDKREADGRPALLIPSRETIRRAINDLDPFHCTIAREGLEAAQQKFRPVGQGQELTRPLQKVEMDVWTADIMTIMATSGLMRILTPEDRERLGLDRGKGRWLVTVAICATTRCIVGMKLSRTATTASALATLEMITRDKGAWADAVGALSPWHQCGTPEEIVMDCGKNFIPYDFRAVCHDLGIRVEHAPAGIAYLRPFIERLFGTVATHLMPRLTGRTFGDIIEKGEYDSAKRAALTADDFCAALIRWVVDIYHRLPHEGLGGESPLACWNRLAAHWGVGAAPDLRRRRIAFGTKLHRTVRRTGIEVRGVQYHEEFLARWFIHAKDRDVNVRWYSEDIGAIEVQLDGVWRTVRAVNPRFNGVRADIYGAAVRELRASYKAQAAIDEDIVFDAIAHIEKINGDAMKRIALLSDDWPQKRVDAEEEEFFLGFTVQGRKTQVPAPNAFIGKAVPTGTVSPETVHTSATDFPSPAVNAPVRTEDSLSQGKITPSRQQPDDAGWGLAEK